MEDEIKENLDRLLDEGNKYSFQNNCYKSGDGMYTKASTDFLAWISSVEHFIISIYSENSAPYSLYKKTDMKYFNGYEQRDFDINYSYIIGALKACSKITPTQNKKTDVKSDLSNIFEKFHLVVRQLRVRYDSRPTIDVSDEYDVQDVLHCLLRLHFDDIRKEEWAPSYAGGASRMDFLLKKEFTVIEVKMTRKGLSDKELGKQLIEDKAKYKAHPDCKSLICFTYDPDGRIINPKGLENDLNQNDPDFKVIVIIKP